MDEEFYQQTVKEGGVIIPRELYATLPRAFQIGWDALSGSQQQQVLRASSLQSVAAANNTSSQRLRKKPRREQHAAAVAVPPAADNNEVQLRVPLVVGNTKNDDRFSSLPQLCITNIFNYVATSPDDVMNMSLISKQSRSDCLHESIMQKIVPTIYLSSGRAKQRDEANQKREQKRRRRSSCRANESKSESEWYALLEMITRTMLQKLKNRQFLMGNDKAQSHYERMELTSLEEFGCIKLSEAVTITNDLSFEGVVSLDMSSPSAVNPQVIDYVHSHEYIAFPTALLSILPCLLEANLTNTKWEDSHLANSFPCSNCFEKLTWNGRRQEYLAHKPNIPNIKRIKEIYMDDYVFEGRRLGTYDDISILWDTEKVSKKGMTIFSNFRSAKKLERLSIRNVRYQFFGTTILFPQRALIKFVRNTLSSNVKWLRSDLSQANIATLQLDHPNVEFVQN